MYARVLIDGVSHDKDSLAKVLKEMLPTEDRFDDYFKAWRFLDRRNHRRVGGKAMQAALIFLALFVFGGGAAFGGAIGWTMGRRRP